METKAKQISTWKGEVGRKSHCYLGSYSQLIGAGEEEFLSCRDVILVGQSHSSNKSTHLRLWRPYKLDKTGSGRSWGRGSKYDQNILLEILKDLIQKEDIWMDLI